MKRPKMVLMRGLVRPWVTSWASFGFSGKGARKYQLVRTKEGTAGYLLDKLGLNLIVHRHFAKLEKVPVVPKSGWGFRIFPTPGLCPFCLLLAYLEGKTVEEQFLLSDLCEELQSTYPGEEG